MQGKRNTIERDVIPQVRVEWTALLVQSSAKMKLTL